MVTDVLIVGSIVVYIFAMAIFYRGGILQSLFGIGAGIVIIYIICYLQGVVPGIGPFVNC